MSEYFVFIIVAALVFLLCLGSFWYTRKKKRAPRLGEIFGIFVIFISLLLICVVFGIHSECLFPIVAIVFLYLTIKASVEIYRKATGKENNSENTTRNNST